jgi:hypothetical protein
MSTVFSQSDSYVLPFCPLEAAPDVGLELADLCAEEVTASQAIAAYQRVVEQDEAALAGVDDYLDELSIDELRRLAAELRVPERNTITVKSELVAEIRRRL